MPEARNLEMVREKAELYREELCNLSPAELRALLEHAEADQSKRYREFRDKEESQQSFNKPDAAADFDHWAKMSFWTIDEAVALSFGKRPDCISAKHIESLKSISPFAKEYLAKRELAMRAKSMRQLWDSTSPAVFLAWAERMRFAMPAELVKAVEALGIQIADWKTLFEQQKELTEQARGQIAEKHAAHMAAIQDHSESLSRMRDHQNELAEGYRGLLDQRDNSIKLKNERIEWLETRATELESAPAASSEKPLGTKERESLLKLVIGMAVGGYGLNPKDGRHKQTKEIADDLERAGVPIDADTVRKYLAEAKHLLPGDETERKV